MLSKEFIIKQIPQLKPTDTGVKALSFMDEYKLRHLPVVKEGQYQFLLIEKEVFQMSDPINPIENLSVYAPFVNPEVPILEVLRLMGNEKLSFLPVVSSDGTYLGGITLEVLTTKLAELTNAIGNGALIALEINQQDYLLSEIVRVVESNNAKILSLFTYPVESTAKLTVLMKINLEDASIVLRSLERFNFHILYYFQEKGLVDDIAKKRLDELMYYLEM